VSGAWSRNAAGVKAGADCYRTIGGVRWGWYAEDAAIFKAAGVRHRTALGGGTFVHPNDDEAACKAAHGFHASPHQHGAGNGEKHGG